MNGPAPPTIEPAARAASAHPVSALRGALTICRADLGAELRRPLLVAGMAAFSLGSLTMLQLALAGSGRVAPAVGAGAAWVVLLLAGIVALGTSIGRDRDQGTWDALLGSSATRPMLAAGKAASLFAILLGLHVLVVPAAWAILAAPRGSSEALWYAGAVLLADIGIAAIAVFAGMVAANARGRELIGPVLIIPLLLPLLVVGVSIGAWSVDPRFAAEPGRLLAFIAIYDAIFVVALWGAAEELATR